MIKKKNQGIDVIFGFSDNKTFKITAQSIIEHNGKIVMKVNPKKYKYKDIYNFLTKTDNIRMNYFYVGFNFNDKLHYIDYMSLDNMIVYTGNNWDGYLYLCYAKGCALKKYTI